MNIKTIVRASVLATLLVAGSAAAQTVSNGVTVSTTPVTSTVAAGSGANLGSVTIVGTPTGATITSIPFTVTPGGGATAANLSNCQLFDSSNQSLTSSGNVVNTIGSGSNVFTLNAPLTVTGTTTLSLRCNVAAGTPSTATFQIAAGAPTLTSALNVNLDTAPSVPAGSQAVALANISIGAMNSGSNANVTSLPVTITPGTGASVANLSNCTIRNTTNLDAALTGTTNVNNGTATTFVFSSPLNVMANTAPMLALVCNVASATPIGGSFTIGITPSTVAATNASTGATITPSVVVGMGPNNLPAATSGTVLVTGTTGTGTGSTGGTGTGSTGTGTGSTSGTGTGTGSIPGVPNTGAGDSANWIVLALAALFALGGIAFLRRQTR